MWPNLSYMGLPLNGKGLTDWGPVGRAPAVRHLLWTFLWLVPTWNLRHRIATRCKRQASCRKSYLRCAVWEEPGWP